MYYCGTTLHIYDTFGGFSYVDMRIGFFTNQFKNEKNRLNNDVILNVTALFFSMQFPNIYVC